MGSGFLFKILFKDPMGLAILAAGHLIAPERDGWRRPEGKEDPKNESPVENSLAVGNGCGLELGLLRVDISENLYKMPQMRRHVTN
jgi:hypothetical protein